MPGRFFDTNVLLYLLSDDHTKADIAEGLLRGGGTVSVQVLNEIANVTQRKLRMSWSQTDEFLLMIREFVTVEPLTYETHDLGIALARKHALSVYDAVIVAAVLLAGCDTLLSEDGAVVRRPEVESVGRCAVSEVCGHCAVSVVVSIPAAYSQAAPDECCGSVIVSNQIDRSELTTQLRRLGLRQGDVVMTHASMRKVGTVAGGGARTLVEAQLDVVGPNGTLLMALGADESEAFDAGTTPVDVEDMGILAEVFRTYPGVCVSDHPAGRLGAIGPLARDILEPTPLHDYHGFGSPLERFANFGGRVLRLGANADTVTLTHYAEYLADVPNKIRVRRRYVRADAGEIWIESLDDTDGIVTWPGGDYFEQIYLDYRSTDAVRVGPVGLCEGELFEAKHFVFFAADWMNHTLAAAE